jgi:hypothetical protein
LNFDLENTDILQVNATLIAGALVYVTISSISTSQTGDITKISGIGLALAVIFSFSKSSYHVITGKKDAAVRGMKYGFIVLVITAGSQLVGNLVVAIVHYYDSVTKTFSVPQQLNHTNHALAPVNPTKTSS